jgi:hypothetical protein
MAAGVGRRAAGGGRVRVGTGAGVGRLNGETIVSPIGALDVVGRERYPGAGRS